MNAPIQESRIRGDVICRCRDEYGEIIIAEEGNTRTLYFGNGVIQSAIRTDRPDLLLEDYDEAMTSALMFNNNPGSVLLIGLGGCSLVHFFAKAVPDCAIDIVEIRRKVIDLARDYFLLPEGNAKTRIFHTDGADFLGQRGADSMNYDMIIVDAFDEAGPAAALLTYDFLFSCRTRLNANGVFIMNLWNSPGHNFPALYSSIKAAFGNNTLKLLLSESYRNAIAFGFKDPGTCRDLPGLRSIAAELQRKYNINYPRYLKSLYWQNFNDQIQQ